MTASHPINAWRNRIVGLVLAVAIYAIDRYVKWLVEGPLELRFEGHHMDLLPFFDLTRTHNHGVSLGAFPATSPEMRWILVAVKGSDDAKCGRCWRLLPDVPEDGSLCHRCEDAVARLDAVP